MTYTNSICGIIYIILVFYFLTNIKPTIFTLLLFYIFAIIMTYHYLIITHCIEYFKLTYNFQNLFVIIYSIICCLVYYLIHYFKINKNYKIIFSIIFLYGVNVLFIRLLFNCQKYYFDELIIN